MSSVNLGGDPTPCVHCGKEIGSRVSLNNYDSATFIYIPLQSRCHLECYIKLCVDKALEERTKKE